MPTQIQLKTVKTVEIEPESAVPWGNLSGETVRKVVSHPLAWCAHATHKKEPAKRSPPDFHNSGLAAVELKMKIDCPLRGSAGTSSSHPYSLFLKGPTATESQATKNYRTYHDNVDSHRCGHGSVVGQGGLAEIVSGPEPAQKAVL